jgi:hypothetical protein
VFLKFFIVIYTRFLSHSQKLLHFEDNIVAFWLHAMKKDFHFPGRYEGVGNTMCRYVIVYKKISHHNLK